MPWAEAAPEHEKIKCLRGAVCVPGRVPLGTLCLRRLGPRNSCCSFSHLLFPGCELTASTKSYTFQVDEEDDSDHILALSVVREIRTNCACPFPWWPAASPPLPRLVPCFLAGLDQGTPLAEVSALAALSTGHGTVTFMEVLEQSQWCQKAAQQRNTPYKW